MAKRNKLDKRIAKREQREQSSEDWQKKIQEEISKPVKKKNWTRIATLNTYEEAVKLKKEVLSEDDSKEVKIKRFGPEGMRYQVKTR